MRTRSSQIRKGFGGIGKGGLGVFVLKGGGERARHTGVVAYVETV